MRGPPPPHHLRPSCIQTQEKISPEYFYRSAAALPLPHTQSSCVQEGLCEHARLEVAVEASPLVASVAGGWREVASGQAFTLDGAGSHDPDLPGAALSFAWTCQAAPTTPGGEWGPCETPEGAPAPSPADIHRSALRSLRLAGGGGAAGRAYRFTLSVGGSADKTLATCAVEVTVADDPDRAVLGVVCGGGRGGRRGRPRLQGRDPPRRARPRAQSKDPLPGRGLHRHPHRHQPRNRGCGCGLDRSLRGQRCS
mmetsp:Transcript_65509/g.207075  ORF Transcript_65509/g.207075 Transcript_65509/m.207075 type:complete len:253 (+) Transcript_65509:1374-2132(+)